MGLMSCIRLLLLVGCGLAHGAVVTQFIGTDDLLLDPPRTARFMAQLRANGATAVTLPLAWQRLQPAEDRFDLGVYDAGLDEVVKAGLNLIVILDSSGRKLLTADVQITGEQAVPGWLVANHPTALSVDFEGQRDGNPDYADTAHLPALERFYREAMAYYRQRYGKRVLGFAPGITHELEVKYAQHGYRWQSHSDAAKAAFQTWLSRNRLSFADNGPPVMNYGVGLYGNAPPIEPRYPAWMAFREQQLADYVCRLTAWIRENDHQSYGYFGQSLSTHDGIYATGVLEEVVGCFDVIAVDFNFYDGWQATPDPRVLPLLVNYAHHLGHPTVLAGLYLERLYVGGTTLTAGEQAAIQNTLDRLQREPTAGLEIGNVPEADLATWQRFQLAAWQAQTPTPKPWRVGLVAGKWTFYLWHGDYAFKRQQLLDALLTTYDLLVQDGRFQVDVLGEKALIDKDLMGYDALIFPHQTTFSDAARAAIFDYHRRGGRLVQDIQFDAFQKDGTPRKSGWADDRFGMAGRQATTRGDVFIVDGARRRLPEQPNLYATAFYLNPARGFELLMPRWPDLQVGLGVRGPNSLAFGFLPQLVEDAKGDFWQRYFVTTLAAWLPPVVPTAASTDRSAEQSSEMPGNPVPE